MSRKKAPEMESREWQAGSERAAQRDGEEKGKESSRGKEGGEKQKTQARKGQTEKEEGAHLASILTV